jgi:hypothetical protein
MCRTGEFNLSYESLTSYNAHKNLCNMKCTNPEFWAELMVGAPQMICDDEVMDEDDVDAAAA